MLHDPQSMSPPWLHDVIQSLDVDILLYPLRVEGCVHAPSKIAKCHLSMGFNADFKVMCLFLLTINCP